MIEPPADALAAATHGDPYPYYSQLAQERGLYHDDALGLWVASSAAAVTAVLTHPASQVRPPEEPVPHALAGTPAGEIFRHLVRMTDGAGHCALKGAVRAAHQGLDAPSASAAAERWAARLANELQAVEDPSRLTGLAFAVPVRVVMGLLGVSEGHAVECEADVAALCDAFLPGAKGEALDKAQRAVPRLMVLLQNAPVVAALSVAGAPSALANAVGMLTQTRDATAALINATLLALRRRPELSLDVPGLLAEVARFDAPVQNTRRFLAEPARLAGVDLPARARVLVLLASANRDPSVNPDPHLFWPGRLAPQLFTFGVGTHACPGARLAVAIAYGAVAGLLAAGVCPDRLESAAFHPSLNCRMPVFSGPRSVR